MSRTLAITRSARSPRAVRRQRWRERPAASGAAPMERAPAALFNNPQGIAHDADGAPALRRRHGQPPTAQCEPGHGGGGDRGRRGGGSWQRGWIAGLAACAVRRGCGSGKCVCGRLGQSHAAAAGRGLRADDHRGGCRRAARLCQCHRNGGALPPTHGSVRGCCGQRAGGRSGETAVCGVCRLRGR